MGYRNELNYLYSISTEGNLRCLFCKQPSDLSKSVEHIIPESIGSKRLVLPAGTVCDKCNNYFARKVEGPILSHQAMRNVRAWYQIPNKKGRPPSLQGHITGTNVNINLRIDNAGKLDIQPEKEKDRAILKQYFESTKNGEEFACFFSIDINPPIQEMSRFLAKMALESLAFRLIRIGIDISLIVDEPHYDLIRNYARFNSGVNHWPYSRRSIFPMDTRMKHPETGEWVRAGFGHDLLITSRKETYFVFLIYGVEFVINTGGPSIKGYEEWIEQNDYISPMVERTGAKHISKVIEGQQQHFIEGGLDIGKGIAFDVDKILKITSE